MGSRRGGPRGNGVNTLDGQVVPQAHPHCGDHRRRRAPDRPDSLRERPHGNPRLPPAGADRRRACRRGGWLAGGVSRRGECGRLTGRARTGSAGRECGGLTRRVSARRTDQSRAEVVQLVGAAGRGDQCAECRVGQRFALVAGRAGLGERGSENTQKPTQSASPPGQNWSRRGNSNPNPLFTSLGARSNYAVCSVQSGRSAVSTVRFVSR